MIPDKQPPSWAMRIASSALVLLVAVLMALKLGLFFGYEYTSDMFIHIEKSRSFLHGMPLLYDNTHGPRPYHNTFIELLFAPFTEFFGGLGLLVPAVLIVGGSFFAILRWAGGLQPYARAHVLTFLFAGLMGPVGFWFHDNPIYGWQPEVTAFPLALLLAVGLVREHTWMVRLSAAGLALTHELGAVICGCIFLLHYTIVKAPQEKSWGRMFSRQAMIVLPWIVLFFAGLVLQRYWDAAGAQRLDSALRAASNPSLLQDVRVMLTKLLMLLCTCGFVFFLFPLRLKAMLATLAACAPLIVATTAASFAYNKSPLLDFHNVFWPPRFAFTWGILCAGVLFSYATVRREQASRWVWIKLAPLALVVIYAQTYALIETRAYSAGERIAKVIHGRTQRAQYTADELRVVECLARETPPSMPVLTNALLYAAFHNHQIHAYREENPYRRKPEIMICDVAKRDWLDGGACKIQQDAWYAPGESRVEQVGGLSIRYIEPRAAIVASCIRPEARP